MYRALRIYLISCSVTANPVYRGQRLASLPRRRFRLQRAAALQRDLADAEISRDEF